MAKLVIIAALYSVVAAFVAMVAEASSSSSSGQIQLPPLPVALRADQSPAIHIPKKLTFKVCGYYCGPNWCANQVISEANCVAQGVWGMAAASGEVVDGCCRTHDDCCGTGVDRPACNTQIV